MQSAGLQHGHILLLLIGKIMMSFNIPIQIDLQTHVVSTIAGTGRQGNDKEGGAVGVAQEISSPWDLALGKSPDSAHPDLLYVAMAGTHQIWLHFLQDANWTKGR